MEETPAPRLNAALPRGRDDGVVGTAIERETAKDQSAKSGFLPINQQPSSAHAMSSRSLADHTQQIAESALRIKRQNAAERARKVRQHDVAAGIQRAGSADSTTMTVNRLGVRP